MDKATLATIPSFTKRDWLLLAHRWVGLLGAPFLLTSILLAMSLTHTGLLNALSAAIYDSKPIPKLNLMEPVVPGSWDQALRLAKLATGKDGHVITSRDANVVDVQSFENHSHDPEVAKANPHTQLLIDTRTMSIVRIEDKTTSLVSQGHGIHAFRFFGIGWLSLATISSISLLALLITGGALAWRDRKAGRQYEMASLWHVRLGQATGVLIVVVALTTLDFEFSLFGDGDRTASHPIPVLQLSEPVRPGSIDQARHLAELAIGAAPRAVFIQGPQSLKFSEAGDGIGGKSVWVNGETMAIKRVSDWRNDRQALTFILHDGRWLGGMNAFNINDAAALGFLFLTISGVFVLLRRRH